ncbi:CpaF family protein [Aquipuribacter hungaricus]|uniref:CpaF family protein n=1 Tax=Aquipuribacter hungaricus TaxID=545624 RepID=A0ABV7WHF7_9MICO
MNLAERALADSGETPVVDHGLVGRLRGVVVMQMAEERRRRLDAGEQELTRDDERRLGRSLLIRALSQRRTEQVDAGVPLPAETEDDAVLAAAFAALFGLGRLQNLLEDQDLSEININGHDSVWLTSVDGTKRAGAPVANSDEELVEWVRNAATYSGTSSKPWDVTNWKIEMALPDGSRLVGALGCSPRPIVSIRLARWTDFTLDDLRAKGDFDHRQQVLLQAMVAARMNVIISGQTRSGKTVLLRAMASEIPPQERIVTVEHFPELGLDRDPVAHPDCIALEERKPNAEGRGAITLADAVETSRRINPDRLIVGEVMGPEIVDMLEAMTQGNDGGFTTIHTRSAREVPARIALYASRVGMDRVAALSLTAAAVDFVVHMHREDLPDGRIAHYVSSIVEVGPFDGQQVVTSEIFRAPPGSRRAVPAAAVSPERTAALRACGWEDTVDHLDDYREDESLGDDRSEQRGDGRGRVDGRVDGQVDGQVEHRAGGIW